MDHKNLTKLRMVLEVLWKCPYNFRIRLRLGTTLLYLLVHLHSTHTLSIYWQYFINIRNIVIVCGSYWSQYCKTFTRVVWWDTISIFIDESIAILSILLRLCGSYQSYIMNNNRMTWAFASELPCWKLIRNLKEHFNKMKWHGRSNKQQEPIDFY